MQDYKKLLVWQKAHALTLNVYRISGSFPQHESYGLRSHLRRAAFHVPSKIAEGCGKAHADDMHRALSAAMGFASELEYSLLLSHDLGYMADDIHRGVETDTIEVKKMLTGLLHSVQN